MEGRCPVAFSFGRFQRISEGKIPPPTNPVSFLSEGGEKENSIGSCGPYVLCKLAAVPVPGRKTLRDLLWQ